MKITDPAQLISRGHRWGQGFIMICMCQQQNLWRRSFWGVIHEGSAFPESGWEPRSESGNICTSQGWEQYEAMMKKLTNLMDYCSHPKTPSYPLQVIQFWPWLHAQKWDTMGHHGTPWDTSQTSFSLQYSEMRRIVPSCFSRSFERSYSMTLRVAICSTVALADTTDWLGPPVSYHFASRRLSGLPRSVIDHWYSI